MIKAADMMNKMGKKKFIEYATHSQQGERMIDKRRRTKWGKNVKSRMCEHGNWVIVNYRHRRCFVCDPSLGFFEYIKNILFNFFNFFGIRISIFEYNPNINNFFIPRDVDYQGFNIGLGGYIDGRSDFKRTIKQKGLVHIGDDRQ